MTSPEQSSPRQVKTRAKQACLHCNRRRIRCNVMQVHPCQNCVMLNVPCEIGVSKRGKYPRKKAVGHHDASDKDAVSGHSISESPAARYGIATQAADHLTPLSMGPPVLQRQLESGKHAHTQARKHTPFISQDSTSVSHQTVFFGESSPLTVVIDEGRLSPGSANGAKHQTRLHYPIPDRLAINTRDEALRAHKKKQEEQLRADGAFSYPPAETCDTLLQAYFTWFHPCFPILDRAAVHQAYVQGSLSPLLLQVMLFIGVSLCTDEAFARTGFSVRYWAKFLFYSRAKAIYDADWESDKIVKVQSLFLLSFWRGGPSEERDLRFWLGSAISLAQKRGMHLMSKFSFHSPREEGLWKRIWWALYTRDQQSAAGLGLPPRIRDEDCDVAMLEPDDIREDEDDPTSFGKQCVEDLSYPIEMAKLAKILRILVATLYSPTESSSGKSCAALHQQLVDWESHIPSELRLENASTPRAKFLAGLLHMTYYNLYILLYRPSFLHPPDGDMDSQGQIALDAAIKSTRILEDLLSHNLVQHGPPHLITHAFSTLCIHTVHFRRSSGTCRKLAEHRARLCLLSLQELQKSWDLENWVLNLFFRCLDDSTARTLRLIDVPAPPPQTDICSPAATTTDSPAISGVPEMATHATVFPPTLPQNLSGDVSMPSDWYSLFHGTEDYTDMLGIPPQDTSLNLQNLEFLYRFL
ncbi:Zn(II)2Cys6 transcription factor [Aspergillus ibericus CBS 121593]|uniref:Zn(II)2Cys6 transcription factor n=1 Tax=Aspergillus ibericus CBS 121593 TaxID=1448316 RepID=A0A395GKT4_9EURO|nr:Zn(II)2Cys6 transcription factor [Aspergillus ibericus CBS 121593]RAK95994.1 Zn(II)2Cys6 transcription factor [Aspergillus ibericus CBS 121593]